MKITSNYKGYTGIDYVFEYEDVDSFDFLKDEKCTQCYAVCFFEGKMVIVHNQEKDHWGLVGGTIEKGESFEETLRREIQEESNMEMLSCLPVGYQKATDMRDGSYIIQLRYVCTAKPYGPFVSDPAGTIDKIALIDPKDHKKYFDWGEIGERIIERAGELLPKIVT
ncbi:MAG: NUDIX domain-containing protein [Candidatus Pacebacteria bacterium]|jgi:ADP-ribose pyrophosphatase YjhB (NUDIX family)|nr:NUDIX domain-containing protein [Candidatus Paceibacterota bacterium]